MNTVLNNHLIIYWHSIQNVKMAVGPIWNTGGTKTVISIPVSDLGPKRAGTEMGGDRYILFV